MTHEPKISPLGERSRHADIGQPSGGVPILTVLLIGLGSILAIAVIAEVAYVQSRYAIRQSVADGNLALGSTISHLALDDLSSPVVDRSVALSRINRAWTKALHPYKESYLCVIGPDGKLELHTSKPEMNGTDVGQTRVSEATGETVLELLKSRGSWSGQNKNFRLMPQLVGYHYEPAIDSLVAVHVQADTVDAGFRSAVAPWIAGLGIIGGILLPCSLGLLFYSSQKSNDRAIGEIKASAEGKERYRWFVEMLPNGVQRVDTEGRITFCNTMLATIQGCEREDLIGCRIWDFEESEENRQALKSLFQHLVDSQPPPTPYCSTITTTDGRTVDVEVIWTYDRDADGKLTGFISIISDVTQRKRMEELIRAENLLFEAAASGVSQSEMLERLTVFVEAHSPGILGSVLLLEDGKHLRHGAGTSLPMQYRLAIDGLVIGEAVGSCGTAAFRREAVIVNDIANDPLWTDYREVALSNGLAACWSTPIKDTDGAVLGTFAFYSRRPNSPTDHQMRLMEIATHLAGLTIGRNRSQEALRKSERQFRSIFEQAGVGVARIDSMTGEFAQVNQRYCDLVGYEPNELTRKTFQSITHPDDLQADLHNMERVQSGQIRDFSLEKRYRHKDGSIVWVNLTVSPLWQIGDSPTFHVAIVEEITKRKEAEFSLRRRDQILAALSVTATQMLRSSDWRNLLEPMLRELGSGTQVSRAYLFESHHHTDQRRLFSQTVEWADAGVDPQVENPALQNLDLEDAGFGRWLSPLTSGQPVHGNVVDFPLSERELLEPQYICSLCVIPIRIADELWGFIGFDQCHESRVWSDTEINTLQIAADTIAAAVLRGKSDAALRESEQRFRTIFEQAAVGVAQLNSMSGTIQRVNHRYCEITGRAETELVGRTWMELSHPDGIAVVQSNMQRLIKGEIREFGIEKRIEIPNGSEVWISLNVSPMWQAGEPTTDHIAIVQDITQRKLDELNQRQLSKRNQGIVSALGEIVYEWNSMTSQLIWDGSYTKILGYSPEEMGSSDVVWAKRIHPDDIEMVSAVIEDARQKRQPYEMEFRILCRDETYLWIHNRGVVANDDADEPYRVIGVIKDISRRKRADEARELQHQSLVKLDESVRRLFAAVGNDEPFFESICQDILKLLPVDLCAVPMVDPGQSTFTYRSAAGHKADLLLGKVMPISGGGLCGWVIENRETLCVSDLASDPRVIPELAIAMEVSTAIVAPIVIEGRVIGGLSLFRKSEPFADYELRTINLFAQSVAAAYLNRITLRSMEQRVVERTAELAETNAELESFARTVSHDLRAPLRAMEGFAAALSEDYGDVLDEDGREFVQHIVASAKRMDRMVNDLLTYSRLGRTQLRLSSIDLNAIVAEALDRISSELQDSHAVIDVMENFPTIVGHKSTLVQVVSNLVSNAVKFVPSGVVPEVRIRSESGGDGQVRLYVQDNGLGIDEEYQDRIFEVFERLHGIENYPGTGIGLAIVARACERLGGRCGLKSALGNGSQFWVEFPQGKLKH